MKEAAELIMQTAPWLVYIFTFLFGVVFGSFLNVCIYRIPKKESIVTVPSHCMTCGKKLHWYELIPLFSWLALRGKCHGCKSRISPQYPIIEASNGILCLIALSFKGLTIDFILTCLLFSALLVISVIDAREGIIPFSIDAFIGVIGLIRALVRIFVFGDKWLDYLLGLVVMFFLFELINIVTVLIMNKAGMGGGDQVLCAAVGLFIGLKGSLLAFFAACVVGSVIHLFLMYVIKEINGKEIGKKLAFGPYLSIGYFISVLWGELLIDKYLMAIGIK